MLQVLNTADEWFIDGTWDICKNTMFEQVWVIVARKEPGISLPCAFYLLPNKQPETYRRALKAIKDKGVSNPAKVHVDFERAEINAVKEELENGDIITCQVHWHRALRKNLTDVGLISFYNKSIEVQIFFRKLWALAFVPVDDVIEVYEQLEKETPEMDEEAEGQSDAAVDFNGKVDKYLNYFQRTWVGPIKKRSKGRGKPYFPLVLWNKREEALNREELTSNSSESWNSVSKPCLPMKPNLYGVMEAFRKEDSLARAKVIEAASGRYVDPNPARTERYQQRKVRMATAVEAYSSLSLDDWLSSMIAFYDD